MVVRKNREAKNCLGIEEGSVIRDRWNMEVKID